jgi:DNA polymerase-3 subunit epsilon
LYAIIDIETTGGSIKQGSRITELACYVFDGNKIIDQFQTLLNPEQNIPSFITRLTGITNEMVSSAPRFFEVAQRIVEMTEGKIFIGHNVQFDYSFVRNEFKSLGYNYERETFCTCRSSRKLIPGFGSYSLGSLSNSLGIKLANHHRAADDALATTKIFELLLQREGKEIIHALVKPAKEPDLNELLESDSIKELLDQTGVYYFYNPDGTIIYIGKAKNIRRRVISHFKNKSARKTERMRAQLADIDYTLTGTELIALLLESAEIKKHQPVFNRSQKRKQLSLGIYDSLSPSGYLQLTIDKIREGEKPIAWVASVREAEKFLVNNTGRFQLCAHYTSLDNSKNACYKYQVKECKGACLGLEDAVEYNKRVSEMIHSLKINLPDVLLVDMGRKYGEKSAILIENGELKGYGFFEIQFANSVDEIKSCITPVDFHPDFQNILRSAIRQNKFQKIIELNKVEELQ